MSFTPGNNPTASFSPVTRDDQLPSASYIDDPEEARRWHDRRAVRIRRDAQRLAERGPDPVYRCDRCRAKLASARWVAANGLRCGVCIMQVRYAFAPSYTSPLEIRDDD